jgi:hypothetical protein
LEDLKLARKAVNTVILRARLSAKIVYRVKPICALVVALILTKNLAMCEESAPSDKSAAAE